MRMDTRLLRYFIAVAEERGALRAVAGVGAGTYGCGYSPVSGRSTEPVTSPRMTVNRSFVACTMKP